MSFFQMLPQDPRGQLAEKLGMAAGQGIGNLFQQRQMQQQQGKLANLLFGDQGGQYGDIPMEAQLKAADIQGRSELGQQKLQQKQQEDALKQQREEQEARILSKYQRGEELTPEETSQLSPTSLRTLIGQDKQMFEKESEKLEAQRSAALADEIEKDYRVYQDEEMRLSRMEKLSDKGDLSTPLMVKGLNALGLPIGILSNPDTEEYSKLEADFLRDVSSVFPGGKITNYEIKSYLKTIPSLMNTPEGKSAIIRNRRLMNEAKKLRYDAYKDILKENQGKKPPNMGLMINERIGHRLNAIENEFREGLQNSTEKYQTPIQMIDPQGRKVNIPPNQIENAIKAGAKFQ